MENLINNTNETDKWTDSRYYSEMGDIKDVIIKQELTETTTVNKYDNHMSDGYYYGITH